MNMTSPPALLDHRLQVISHGLSIALTNCQVSMAQAEQQTPSPAAVPASRLTA